MKRRSLVVIGTGAAVAMLSVAISALSERHHVTAESRTGLMRLQTKWAPTSGSWPDEACTCGRRASLLAGVGIRRQPDGSKQRVPRAPLRAGHLLAAGVVASSGGMPAAVSPGFGLPKVVPDVFDLGLDEAERRLVAAGFAFSTRCPGEAADLPSRPSRYSPNALVRVTRNARPPVLPLQRERLWLSKRKPSCPADIATWSVLSAVTSNAISTRQPQPKQPRSEPLPLPLSRGARRRKVRPYRRALPPGRPRPAVTAPVCSARDGSSKRRSSCCSRRASQIRMTPGTRSPPWFFFFFLSLLVRLRIAKAWRARRIASGSGPRSCAT